LRLAGTRLVLEVEAELGDAVPGDVQKLRFGDGRTTLRFGQPDDRGQDFVGKVSGERA
jgi:hypothetical protein